MGKAGMKVRRFLIQLWDQLGYQFGVQLQARLWGQLREQLRNQLLSQIWVQLRDQIQTQAALDLVCEGRWDG